MWGGTCIGVLLYTLELKVCCIVSSTTYLWIIFFVWMRINNYSSNCISSCSLLLKIDRRPHCKVTGSTLTGGVHQMSTTATWPISFVLWLHHWMQWALRLSLGMPDGTLHRGMPVMRRLTQQKGKHRKAGCCFITVTTTTGLDGLRIAQACLPQDGTDKWLCTLTVFRRVWTFIRRCWYNTLTL